MTVAAIASLVVGLIIGFLGQRSRICFVGAIRDFLLIRDTYLLKGVVAFILVAWVAFPVSKLLGGATPLMAGAPALVPMVLTAIGGFGVGYVSILANGCPFRQHVLAAQGAVNAVAYLVGFWVGAVAFHGVVNPTLARLLNQVG